MIGMWCSRSRMHDETLTHDDNKRCLTHSEIDRADFTVTMASGLDRLPMRI